jgi:voltage-gated potassium channel
MKADDRNRILRRAAVVFAVFAALLIAGTAAFVAVGDEPFDEAFYRALASFTTANIVPEPDTGAERALAAALTIIGGLFYLALIAGVVQAIVVRNALTEIAAEWKAGRRIKNMSGHYIVCGYGRVGQALTKLLREREKDVVVVDLKEAARTEIERTGATLVVGDADRQDTLTTAGVVSAEARVACTHSDRRTSTSPSRLGSVEPICV